MPDDERAPKSYRPVLTHPRGIAAGRFSSTPAGVILHGSRSGLAGRSTAAEFVGTANYATIEPNGYGWNATVGDDELALHLDLSEWGWNARGCSGSYLAAEFAQATVGDAISDGQVRAFCWFVQLCSASWPALPMNFPTHAELDGSAAYGYFDGKSDVFPKRDARADELRGRILTRLGEQA